MSAGGGNVQVSAAGSLTVAEDVTTPGNVLLTTLDAAGSQDLSVLGGASVSSGSGNVTLHSGDNVTLAAGSTVSAAAGLVTIVGDFSGTDSGNGSLIQLLGRLVSGSQAMVQGGPDADSITLSPDADNCRREHHDDPAGWPRGQRHVPGARGQPQRPGRHPGQRDDHRRTR